jgi:hypothetical protein
VCAVTAISLLYLSRFRPPDCTDPRTVAQVRQEIRRRIGQSPPPDLVGIVTLAGSRFGIRYVCRAEFSNPDRLELPNGVLANSVRYSSALANGYRQQVTVSLVPLLHWQEME